MQNILLYVSGLILDVLANLFLYWEANVIMLNSLYVNKNVYCQVNTCKTDFIKLKNLEHVSPWLGSFMYLYIHFTRASSKFVLLNSVFDRIR